MRALEKWCVTKVAHCIYVHDSLKYVLVEALTLSNYSESVWCSIRLANSDELLVGSVYSSPSSSKNNNLKLNALLKIAVQFEHSHILIWLTTKR